jgi:hypothetical protein
MVSNGDQASSGPRVLCESHDQNSFSVGFFV